MLSKVLERTVHNKGVALFVTLAHDQHQQSGFKRKDAVLFLS